MKHLFLSFTFLIIIGNSFGQNYWQQEVNYKINVRLNDSLHTLSAFEEFEYINNSPNQLDFLYIHLWPNAYKNEKTALAKQKYQSGDSKLTFGDDKVRGSIDSLDFKVNGVKAKWEFDPTNIDIAILHLDQPIKSGERVTVSTPFSVKIPSGSISRLGHIGQSYQITQWFPKPAVYDKDGWKEMPYLNQGEFYSEFGSFDVTITLPKNYVVGATGDLQTEEEINFLNAKSDETLKKLSEAIFEKKIPVDFPPSDSEYKTIRYTQDRVHDFAWFADKRYVVTKGEVILPHSKRKVNTYAMWVPNNSRVWKNADEYIRDAVYYYSLWNGDYPYNNVTAVDGTISAGGGMEYPTITVIGNASNADELEVVIVHEVGHNWFYGILGSNERVHGWMDEGINTLNEVRYIQTKYPSNKRLSDMVLGGKLHMNDLDYHDMGDFAYRMLAILGIDQPIETHSVDYSSINYGIIMYQKTGLVFHYLKDYLGEELFDKCMQAYFEEWKFKHPQPEDMRATLERTSGKELSWLFENLIQTTNRVDFKLKKVKIADKTTTVTVKNIGQVPGPIEVNLIKNGEVYATKWTNSDEKKATLEFESETKPDEVAIDISRDIPEIYRNNNNWRSEGMFKKMEPLKLELLIGDNEQTKTNLFWTPIIAGNFYDKFMLGAAIHNNGIPFNRFQYLVAPMYSFGRQMVSGIAEFSYTVLPKTVLKTARFGLSIKSFKNDSSFVRKSDGAYLSIAPYWSAKLATKKYVGAFSHDLLIQGILKYNVNGSLNQQYTGGFIRYNMDIVHADHKLNVKLRNDFIKASDVEMSRILLESTYQFRYLRKNMQRWVELRGFIGSTYHFNSNSLNNYPYAMSMSGSDGQQDLFFEEYYFGRNNIDGLWSQQRNEDMGGFKSSSYSYGITTNWMATSNLYVQLPIPKLSIFGAFADFGMFSNGVSTHTAINTGLAIRFGKIFGLYFPVWMSKELSDSFGNSKYAEKIRFTLKFNPINKPLKLGSILN